MIKEEYKYSDITQKIIGCAIKVHNTLGNGFQEIIYQRALAIEMYKQGLTFVIQSWKLNVLFCKKN
jgi:GxxExxY protein